MAMVHTKACWEAHEVRNLSWCEISELQCSDSIKKVYIVFMICCFIFVLQNKIVTLLLRVMQMFNFTLYVRKLIKGQVKLVTVMSYLKYNSF